MLGLFLLLLPFLSANDKGYDIRVELKNAPSDTLLLGYYYAERQYVRDTAIGKNGIFHFQDDSSLAAGIYILVMPPKFDFIQLFINEDEQQLEVKADALNTITSIQVWGSDDNNLFYDYLRFLETKRPQAQVLQEKLKAEKEAGKPTDAVQQQLDQINQDVKNRQVELTQKFPKTITAMLIRATFEVEVPEMAGTPEEVEQKKYLWYKTHYFDHLALSDPRLLRSPLIHDRINYFVEKLTLQHPDSIKSSLDDIFRRVKPAEETFKYYLIHFINHYAASKIVGFDGIYVHLVDEYYAKGFAPWVGEEQLDKMKQNAASLRPILIGKTAPEIKLIRHPDGKTVSLHGIRSPYTVLFIWDPECSHCKASLPHVSDFYSKYKDRGVEILAVCSQFTDKVPACWKYLEEQKMDPGWINAADPQHASRFKILYDVKTTPQIFILDADKKILSKNIGAEQLPEVMDHILTVPRP